MNIRFCFNSQELGLYPFPIVLLYFQRQGPSTSPLKSYNTFIHGSYLFSPVGKNINISFFEFVQDRPLLFQRHFGPSDNLRLGTLASNAISILIQNAFGSAGRFHFFLNRAWRIRGRVTIKVSPLVAPQITPTNSPLELITGPPDIP